MLDEVVWEAAQRCARGVLDDCQPLLGPFSLLIRVGRDAEQDNVLQALGPEATQSVEDRNECVAATSGQNQGLNMIGNVFDLLASHPVKRFHLLRWVDLVAYRYVGLNMKIAAHSVAGHFTGLAVQRRGVTRVGKYRLRA